MAITIPLLCFGILFLIFYADPLRSNLVPPCWRGAFLSAAVIWGIFLIAITECLSPFSLLTFKGVVISWILVAAVSVSIYFKISYRPFPAGQGVSGLSSFDKLSIIFILFVIATVGLIAVLAPPNTWDSMTYHMSRVFHWVQNQSVGHYPTHIEKQLHYSPGAEFIITHFQVLSGSDRFANLVQWFSMVGSIIGVSLVAERLGADKRGQIFAAVICATIPMGILQGSSTQNDYVASFWTVSFAYYALLAIQREMSQRVSIVAGGALGLALLSKGTAYFFCIPLLVWMTLRGFKNYRKKILFSVLTILLVSIGLNLGYFWRNNDLYGNIYVAINYANHNMTAPLFISNVLRNIVLHFSTPLAIVNDTAYALTQYAHQFLGVALNDERITLLDDFNRPIEFYIPFALHEDSAANFVHSILIIACVMMVPILHFRKKTECRMGYMTVLICGFLMLCFYVPWMPWNHRYHLPFFVLFSPLIAVSISDIRQRANNNLIIPVTAILILYALPWLALNSSKRLIGEGNIFEVTRRQMYYTNNPKIKDSYSGAIEFIISKEFRDIGLVIGGDTWEYPMIQQLAEKSKTPMTIRHVNVQGASSKKYTVFPFDDFSPDAILVCEGGDQEKIIYNDIPYSRGWSSDYADVFVRM
jgi:4-amino-4-deoxy-L-arabinose transferase-like glycosyltransferase